jgi:polyketide synthase PksN
VVVGEYEVGQEEGGRSVLDREARVVIPLSARTGEQLKQKVEDLLGWIEREPGVDLEALAYTLQVGRTGMEQRVGLLVSSVEGLKEKLKAYIGGQGEVEDIYKGDTKGNKEALALFTTDLDLQQAVGKWMVNKKLAKLLELWVKGLELDWKKLYGEKPPRRLRLPLYPFARERYWIDGGENGPAGGAMATTGRLHPLLHRNTSDLSEQRYSSTFTGEEFFLADHRVRMESGALEKVLPGVACLEMARAAIQLAWPAPSDSSVLELRNTLWLKPIIISGNVPLSIVISPNEDDAMTFSIYSFEKRNRITHCEGEAAFVPSSAPSRINIQQLKTEMQHGRLDGTTLYPLLATMGLNYGPAHQGIMSIDLGERQLLAQLRLPPIVESSGDQYVLHPSVVDSALQAAIGFIVDRVPKKPLVPFVLDSLKVIAPCTAKMLAWLRYSPDRNREKKIMKLDVDLLDPQGNICIQMQGFTSRILDQAEGWRETISVEADGSSDREPSFDTALYRKLVADIVNHKISVEEALELG